VYDQPWLVCGRIEALLNATLSDVAYADLQRLVTGRVLDVDIDFKSEPHKDGQDLAVDVSAMANTVGGVLVIGMAEAEGAATELKPCPLSDDDTNRMRQWLAELVVPYSSTEYRSAAPLRTACGAFGLRSATMRAAARQHRDGRPDGVAPDPCRRGVAGNGVDA
jgi:hypothetical protein